MFRGGMTATIRFLSGPHLSLTETRIELRTQCSREHVPPDYTGLIFIKEDWLMILIEGCYPLGTVFIRTFYEKFTFTNSHTWLLTEQHFACILKTVSVFSLSHDFHILLDSKAPSFGRFPCLHCTAPRNTVHIAISMAGDLNLYVPVFVNPSFTALTISFFLGASLAFGFDKKFNKWRGVVRSHVD